MSREIDHLVLAVRDLDSASAFYERLGFNLTPQAQHPFGTGNRLAQLGNDFLEILSVTRPQDVVETTEGAFSFGAYNRDYLDRREGMSMIALKSEGWQTDRQTFINAGFRLPEPFTFSRLARQPDGSDVKVGFDLTFVPDAGLPEAVFFTCDHQHEPEFFYKPQFQKHDNGALAVDDVFMVCDDPKDIESFLARLYGGKSNISIFTKDQLTDRFPGHDSTDVTGDAVFAGYRVRVSDIEITRSVLTSAAVAFSDKGESLWICAYGSIIEFSDDNTGGQLQ